jgi:phosphate acetyltransferase
LRRAKPLPRRPTAIVNAGADIAMESARLATDEGLIEPILIGDEAAIKASAARLDWDIAGYRLEPTADEEAAAKRGAAIAGAGEAAAIMKGHIHTDTFMAAILDRDAGLRTGRRFSHVFHMTVPDSDGELMITDAAVNIAPDLDTKMQILLNAVDMARALGQATPRVAVLSGTEEATERMPSSMAAAELARRAEQAVPDALVYGPLAFDNAVSPAAAALKGIDHPVAGHADILLVPNIETGNALFKLMVYFMAACAAGIVLGAKVPIILTSRADPPAARLAATAIAALLATDP